MLLKRVKMHNFRPYYGDNEIFFSTSSERNVTVIHAENGVGKTAILNSILWTFFGKVTSNFREPKMLLNNAAKKEGKSSCFIEIEFEEDGREFLIRRAYNQERFSSILKLYEISGGTYSPEKPDPEMFINTILPREMAEYFFFQGEGSSAIEGGAAEGSLAQSIKDIMGFKIANSLDRSLAELVRKVRSSIASQDRSGESQKIEVKLERAESKSEQAIDSRLKKTKLLEKSERDLELVEAELDKINNKDLSSLRQRERKAEAELRAYERDKANCLKEQFNAVGTYGWSVFGQQFAQESLDFIDDSELKGKLPEPYNQSFIRDILSAKECICGGCLEPGSDGWKRITEMLQKGANPILLQRLSGVRAQIQDIKTTGALAPNIVNNLINNYGRFDQKIEEKKSELQSILTELNAIPEKQISQLQVNKAVLKKDIGDLNRFIGSLNTKILEADAEIKSLAVELSRQATNSVVIDALKVKQLYVEELKEYLVRYLDKAEKDIRLHILSEVNRTLNKFSRHDYKIKVSEADFKIHLLDKNDVLVAPGDGLNLLLNLTITASLIQFAASRRKVADSILSSATVAPLVIDAAFGVLDDAYRNVVVNLLPDYARQVIFLVSSSQWTAEMEGNVKDKIGKEYYLLMEESGGQGEKELDKISIKGDQYVVSKYGCDVDRSRIVEIKV